MRRIILVILFTFAVSILSAQVSMQPNVPVQGIIQKNHLWNVLLVNSTGNSQECRLELVLRDRASGEEVMTATSNVFTLNKGSKQLNVNSVNPVSYNYLLPGINNSLQGLVPAGDYSICYQLISAIKGNVLAD